MIGKYCFSHTIAQNEGWTVSYIPCEWDHCLQALQQGEIDLMPAVAFNAQRNEVFDFNTVPVVESWSHVYAAPRLSLTRISDLAGKRIALLTGSIQEATFQKLMKGFGYQYTAIRCACFEKAFRAVNNKEADAVISNNFFGEMHFEQFGLVKTPIVLNPVSLHFAVRKNTNSHIITTIDRYLREWKDTPNSLYYQRLAEYMKCIEIPPEQKITQRRINRLSKIFEYSLNEIYLFDAETLRFVEVNRAALDNTGYTLEYMKTCTLYDINLNLSAKELTRILVPLKSAEKEQTVFETTRVKQDGTSHDVEVYIQPVRFEDESLFAAIILDITERKKAENELAELKDKLKKQVEEKTQELQAKVTELERFRNATINRELRMKELRDEIERLKKQG